MADNPTISSLQLLTIVYYNNCYFRKPRCGGGGRKFGALVQTSIKRPPFFFAELRCKKGGAYNRASTVLRRPRTIYFTQELLCSGLLQRIWGHKPRFTTCWLFAYTMYEQRLQAQTKS